MPARILVIEDNPANMELMVYLLKSYGHEPLCAYDGSDGLAMAFHEEPDVIVCDVNLPRLDGYGVITALKQHSVLRAVPAIAVTALAMVGDREKLLSAGFDGYISKPINPETFVAQLDSYMSGDSSMQDIGNHVSVYTRAKPATTTGDEIETCLHQRLRSKDGDYFDR